MAGESLLEIKDDDYETIIKNGCVLIDFWAPWCGPCLTMTPIVETIAERYKDKVTVGKCNVDETPNTASALNIQSIPTIILYNNGEIVERFIGVTQEDVLADIIDFELEP